MEITEEQKQLLQRTILENGTNAWDYVLTENEADRPWAIAGILSCMKKDYNLNSLMICWEARDLRRSMSQTEQSLTVEQKQQLQGITIHNGTNAWEHVLKEKEADRYWVALGILSCIKEGYGLTILEINSEARGIRAGRIKL